MASLLTPYLTFDGTAREAMAFYRSVFGGELRISTFGEFGGGPGVDPEGVMHAQLETPAGYVLMASDTPGREVPGAGNVTLCLSGDDADALRTAFARLSEGGRVTLALEAQVWGDEFGQLVDRFGIAWMVNLAPAGAPAPGA